MALKKGLVGFTGIALLLCGCISPGGPRPAQRAAAGVAAMGSLTVRLDENGIADPSFRNPRRPQILKDGTDLLLSDQEEIYDFDVTFILDVSEATMKQYIGRSDVEGTALVSQFVDSLKQDVRFAPYDVECPKPPRCEVTVQTSGHGETAVTKVPYSLMDLGGAKITPFYVFLVKRNPTSYQDAPQPRGFVGLELKFAPELEVPLDNTGIADWRLLNPRSPRTLSGTPPSGQAPTRNPEERTADAESASPIKALKEAIQLRKTDGRGIDAPGRAVLDRIENVVQLAVAELKIIEETRLLRDDQASAAIRVIEQHALKAVQTQWPLEDEKTVKEPLEKCPERPQGDEAKKLTALTVSLGHATEIVCESSLWVLDHIAGKDVPAESVDRIELTQETIKAVTVARSIVSTALRDNYLDVSNAEKAGPMIARIDDTRERGQKALDALKTSTTVPAQEALISLVVGRTEGELAAVISDANTVEKAITMESDRFSQKQRLVRFSNQTLDRTYVVTFEVEKDKLVADVPSCPEAEQITKEQNDKRTAALLRCIEAEYEGGISLTPTDGKVNVSFIIDPGSKVDIDAWLLSKAKRDIVPFEVDFFDQTDDPAYSRGYIARKQIDPSDPTVQPESKFATNLITGFTGTYEPCFGKLDNCTGTLRETPYDGKMKEHYSASGQADFSQELGSRANAKLSLLYKKSDFGIGSDEGAKVPQYQINIFGTNNTTVTLGKFSFFQSSNQIATSVSGEGLRVAFHNLAVSYLINRESDDGTSDYHNKDHDVLIAQWRQSISRSRFLRRIDFMALQGEDRCKAAVRPPDPPATKPDPLPGTCRVDDATRNFKGFPHTYETFGTEMFFTVPFGPRTVDPRQRKLPLTATLGVYYSEKDSRQPDPPPADSGYLNMRDGDGTVALLTVGRPFGFVPEAEGSKKVKPTRVLSALMGWGSGDDPKTPEDEGYLGETAAFTRDLIFLSGIANRLGGTKTDADFAAIGKGLSNKTYYGLQYTNNNTSLLKGIAELLEVDLRDIVSLSTTISLHHYRLHEPVFGHRDAGFEADIELRMEQPRNVKWKVAAGYFDPGDALRSIVTKQVWAFTAGVVVEPARLAF